MREREAVQAWLAGQGIFLEALAWERLEEYAGALEAAAVNLTAWRGAELWWKGIADSLAGLAVWDGPGPAADIGSGNGQPGLVLAVARPAVPWVLVEAREKRARFLQAMVARLGLGGTVEVAVARAEAWWRETAPGPGFRMVGARAVGPVRLVAELTLPPAAVGGLVLWWRGPAAPAEVEAEAEWIAGLGGQVTGYHPYLLPGDRGHHTLVMIRKQQATPARFPRTGAGLGR